MDHKLYLKLFFPLLFYPFLYLFLAFHLSLSFCLSVYLILLLLLSRLFLPVFNRLLSVQGLHVTSCIVRILLFQSLLSKTQQVVWMLSSLTMLSSLYTSLMTIIPRSREGERSVNLWSIYSKWHSIPYIRGSQSGVRGRGTARGPALKIYIF